MKRCSKCREVLPLDAFGAHRRYPDGRRSCCRECHKVYKVNRRRHLEATFAQRHPERAAPRPCPRCHGDFMPRRMGGNLQVYCSRRCRVAQANGRARAGEAKSRWLAGHQGYHKKLSVRRKMEVFAHYGGASCACCGESILDFLTIDHINGGGNRHRREIRTVNLYAWLRANHYPAGYRVLCMNCNWGSRYSECPHKTARAANG